MRTSVRCSPDENVGAVLARPAIGLRSSRAIGLRSSRTIGQRSSRQDRTAVAEDAG